LGFTLERGFVGITLQRTRPWALDREIDPPMAVSDPVNPSHRALASDGEDFVEVQDHVTDGPQLRDFVLRYPRGRGGRGRGRGGSLEHLDAERSQSREDVLQRVDGAAGQQRLKLQHATEWLFMKGFHDAPLGIAAEVGLQRPGHAPTDRKRQMQRPG
jgi:hypothetical protein